MDRKFRGRDFEESTWKWWQLLLFRLWCSFDWVIFPMVIAVSSLLKKRSKRKRRRRNEQDEDADEEEEEVSHVKGLHFKEMHCAHKINMFSC